MAIGSHFQFTIIVSVVKCQWNSHLNKMEIYVYASLTMLPTLECHQHTNDTDGMVSNYLTVLTNML